MRTHKSFVSRALSAMACALVALAVMTPMSANATIHEIVAAFCSGGDKGKINAAGFLEAPGVSGFSNADNFAKPVAVNGATNVVSENPLIVLIAGSPSAKFPEGTTVVNLQNFTFLAVSESNHPSTVCKNFSDLP
jgi:hypothetical protein